MPTVVKTQTKTFNIREGNQIIARVVETPVRCKPGTEFHAVYLDPADNKFWRIVALYPTFEAARSAALSARADAVRRARFK